MKHRREHIHQKIKRLQRLHRNDNDGGYAFVRDIEKLFKSLSDEERQLLIDELIDVVNKRDPTLWGVAIESLVRCQCSDAVEHLFKLSQNGERDYEWLDQVFLALARLGHKERAKEIGEYIQDGLKRGRNAVIPILAALCRIDLSHYTQLTSDFLIKSVNKNRELVESYASAFLRNIIEEDENILCDLLDYISSKDKFSAEKIANVFKDYLDRPWIRKEYGVDRVNLLKGQINRL